MSTYDLVTVDWNHNQTRLWLYHVRKHCPTANIVLVPDTKLFPWNWSSGKLACFFEPEGVKHPSRFIYMDTDTIVTRDLEEAFDLQGDAPLGMSSAIPGMVSMSRWSKVQRGREMLDAEFGLGRDNQPVHFSSGFMVLKNTSAEDLGEKWRSAMEYPPLRRQFSRHRCYEEIALSYVVAADRTPVWHMPLEIHGNILRKCYFGNAREPLVIHYHKPERLRAQKLGGYLAIKE